MHIPNSLEEAKLNFGKKVKVSKSDPSYPDEGIIVGVSHHFNYIVKGGTWWSMDPIKRKRHNIGPNLIKNGECACHVSPSCLEIIN